MRAWIFFAVALVAMPCCALQRVPYIPASESLVLQTVPARTDPRVRAFNALRDDVRRHPHDAARASILARAYIDFGRATSDARYLGRAEGVLAPWLAYTEPPLQATLLHATILQSKHEFADARSLLLEVLGRDKRNAQAWLTLATIAQVQGDLKFARGACAHLIGSSDPLIPGGCLASLNAVDGHASAAAQLLDRLLPQARAAPIAEQAWFLGIAADTAVILGDAGTAERHFQDALQLAPGDNFLIADYADFLLDQRRPADALTQVRDYASSDTAFLRQVFAELAMGSAQAAADIDEMTQRFAAIDKRGSRTYRREQAMFALHARHDAVRALALAQENWQVQRAPKDARIFLQAALAAHRPAAARPVLLDLDTSHLQDAHVTNLAAQVAAQLTTRTISPRASNTIPATREP